MPKETFFNLPEQKRQMIEDAAIDEFATWRYDNASINRIVEACQIAKGSFYQYFDDKKDLYKYLILRIGEEKLKFISPQDPANGAGDLFAQLAEMYRAGLAFACSYPKAALIGSQLYKNLEHPVHQEIMADGKEMALGFFGLLVKQAKERGEVRPDVDVNFVAYVLMQTNVNIVEYYFDVVKHSEFDMSQLDDDMLDTVEQFLGFVKSGIWPASVRSQ